MLAALRGGTATKAFTQQAHTPAVAVRRSCAQTHRSQQGIVVAAANGCSSTGSEQGDVAGGWARQACSRAAAVLAASTLLLSPGSASAAYSAAMIPEDAFEEEPAPREWVMSPEEAKFDGNLMTAELRSFLELLDAKGNNVKAQELEGPREKLGFRRLGDGRVFLKSPAGRWYAVKADLQAPGFLLLRDEVDGSVHYLPPDDGGQLMQVDLSDDAIVAQLFSSGAWFDVMDPLKVQQGSKLVPLQMTSAQFRLTSSLLEDAEEEVTQQ